MRIIRKISIILSTFFFMMLLSCVTAPGVMIELTPVKQVEKWDNGKKITYAETATGGIIIQTSVTGISNGIIKLDWNPNNSSGSRFIRLNKYLGKETDNGVITMKVNIVNKTKKAFLVDPAIFFYDPVYSEAYLAKKKKTEIPGPAKAFDPELIFMGLRDEINTETNMQSLNAALDCLGCCLGAAASTAATSKGKHKKARRIDNDMDETLEDSEESFKSNMDELTYKKEYFEKTLLRKNTLEPGVSIEGQVYFPVKIEADSLIFVFPIDDKKLSTAYTIKVNKTK